MKLALAICAALVALAFTACKKAEDKRPPIAPAPAAAPKVPAPAAPPSAPAAAASPQEMTITSSSPAAVAALRRARELLEGFLRDEAKTELERALTLDPKLAQAHALLAEFLPGPEGDKETAVAHRLDEYDRRTAPLIEYYSGRALFRRIDGYRPVDSVFGELASIVEGRA